MLSDQEKTDYLINQVLPVYTPLTKQNIWMGIIDSKFRFRWMTESLQQLLGLGKELVNDGYSYIDFPPQFIEQFCSVNRIKTEEFISIIQKISKIMWRVINEKEAANFVILLPFVKAFQGYLRTDIPIIHPSGEVVGIRAVVSPFSFFGIQEFISILNKGEYEPKTFFSELDSSEFYNNLKLSPRQKEVLFLVSQGISQDYASQILGIKRGTLSKIITDQICPKFGIFPPHYIKLLEIVRREGLDKYIPQTFWRTYILEYR